MREYIDPTIGVATLPVRATLTVMVGARDENTRTSIKHKVIISSLTLHSDGPGC
jgi:hypothetical protein